MASPGEEPTREELRERYVAAMVAVENAAQVLRELGKKAVEASMAFRAFAEELSGEAREEESYSE